SPRADSPRANSPRAADSPRAGDPPPPDRSAPDCSGARGRRLGNASGEPWSGCAVRAVPNQPPGPGDALAVSVSPSASDSASLTEAARRRVPGEVSRGDGDGRRSRWTGDRSDDSAPARAVGACPGTDSPADSVGQAESAGPADFAGSAGSAAPAEASGSVGSGPVGSGSAGSAVGQPTSSLPETCEAGTAGCSPVPWAGGATAGRYPEPVPSSSGPSRTTARVPPWMASRRRTW